MQNKKIKIFIIAGEVSGDVLGASIMQEMPDANFVGIGGENMTAAGLKSLFPMADLSVMGIIEVLLHSKTLLNRVKQTVEFIINEKPDIILTIDSPGFAKSIIKKLKNSSDGKKLINNGMKFYHVVAPQVWAWREGRAKKYATLFDKLYAFFDFEVPYFTKYGLDTVAVGHPIADSLLRENKKTKKDVENKEKIITLVPGSRMTEVKRLLPIFREVIDMLVANGYEEYKFYIPTVETTDEYVRKCIENWSVKPKLVSASERYMIYSETYIAIVASGTVSAELAMLHVPTIVVYKMNPITMWVGRQIVKVKWVSLLNILLNQSIFPEFLGKAANPENIISAVQKFTIPSIRKKLIDEMKKADDLWVRENIKASKLIAEDIKKSINL